jgi:hypothetical protein
LLLRVLLACLVVGSFPGWGSEQNSTVPIILYTKFDKEPPKAVMDALQDELDAIMEPIGLGFEWRSLAGVHGNEVSVELAVISFKGQCDSVTLLPHTSNPGPLGWTHVSDGVILPFSDVDCDRIHAFMQKDLQAESAARRDAILGRAVGRVLAHELYHIFANTSQHGSCGVGKAAYTVRELLSDDFQFEAKESLALRRSPAMVHLENAASPTKGGLDAPL